MKKPASQSSAKQRLHYREQAQEEGHFQETVGADLRSARTDRSLTIDDVAHALRLKAANIRAIEQSDFDALPGKTYAIGFVRAYAQHMGAKSGEEAEEYVRRFKAEMTDAEELKFNSITRKDPGKRIPYGLLAMGALTLILAIMVWRMADRAVGAGDDVMDAFQPGLPEAATPAGASVDSGTGTVDADAIQKSELPDGTLWGGENHDARIRIKALSDVWLRIEVEGRVMFERVLAAGDSYAPPARGETHIATRNASELEIYVDGGYIGHLGEAGDGFAGAKLDPDALLQSRR